MPENTNTKAKSKDKNRDEFDTLIETGSIEDLFQGYLKKIYGLETHDKDHQPIIAALRDAFFAGIAIGKISESREHSFQLLQYAMGIAKNPEIYNKMKEGWIH